MVPGLCTDSRRMARRSFMSFTVTAAVFASFRGRELPVDMVPRVLTLIFFIWVDGRKIFPKLLPGKWRRMAPAWRRSRKVAGLAGMHRRDGTIFLRWPNRGLKPPRS